MRWHKPSASSRRGGQSRAPPGVGLSGTFHFRRDRGVESCREVLIAERGPSHASMPPTMLDRCLTGPAGWQPGRQAGRVSCRGTGRGVRGARAAACVVYRVLVGVAGGGLMCGAARCRAASRARRACRGARYRA
eukprot:scaffold22115_cov124-Isochrysis_galbana.AAC.2